MTFFEFNVNSTKDARRIYQTLMQLKKSYNELLSDTENNK